MYVAGRNLSVGLKLLSLLFLTSAVSCTRPSLEQTSVSISLPASQKRLNKVGTLSAATLSHVIINIRGEGINQPIYFSWDLCHECGVAAPPSSFDLMVPRGNDRLVQLLAVYSDDTGSDLMYGDVTKSLSNAQEEVVINVASIATSSLISGRISGRYLTGSNQGPSGEVLVKYTPANRPAMIIESAPMVSGWFSVFGLKDVKFNYELQDGKVLFANTDLDSLTGSNLLKVEVPSHYRNDNGTYRPQEASVYVNGFWGDAAAVGTKTACYSSGTLSRSYSSIDGINFTPLAASFGTLDPSKASFVGPNCSGVSGTSLVDYMSISPVMIESGNDRAAGFAVPFKLSASMGGDLQAATVTNNGASASIALNLLPDVGPNQIEKLVFFKRTGATLEFRDQKSGTPCAAIASGMIPGFSPVAEKVLTSGVSAYSQDIPMQTSDWGNTQVAVCALTQGHFSNLGTFLDRYYFGGGGNGGPPTQLALRKVKQPFAGASTYACEELVANLLDANNQMTVYGSNLAINLTGSDGTNTAQFYATQMDCSSYSNSVTSVTLPANQNEMRFYVKTTSTSAVNLTLGATHPGTPTLTPASLILAMKTYPDKVLILEASQRILPGQCYGGKVVFSDYSGYAYPVGGPTTISLTASGGLQYFSDATCSTSTSSVTIGAASSDAPIWLKLPSTNSNIVATLSVSSGDPADSASVPFYSGSGGTTLAQIMLTGPNSLQVNNCSSAFQLTALNDQGTPIPLSSLTSISASMPGVSASFYSDNSCTASLPANLPAGVYAYPIFAKATTAGYSNLNVNLGALSTNQPVTVNGLFSLSLSTSESTPVNSGTCLQVELQPRNLDSTPGYFNSPTSMTLGQGFFANRIGSICTDSISNFQVQAYDSSVHYLYVVATNNSPSSGFFNATTSAAGVLPANFSIPVNGAPPLAAIDGATSFDITAEYIFNLEKVIVGYSGISPFVYNKTGGAGALSSNLYTPFGSDMAGASFTINDNNSQSLSFTTVEHARSSSLDFTSLLNGGSLTRSSTAYYYDAAGIMTSATANTPRFDHDPDSTSSYAAKGLLIEGPSTNLIAYSENVTGAGWSTNSIVPTPTVAPTITSPRNATSDGVYLVEDTNLEPYNVGRISYTFTSDMVNNQDYVASMFVKANTSNFAGLMLQENSIMSTGVVINLTNGQVSQMEGPNTPQIKQGVGVQKLNNGWYRVWVRYHSDASCGSCQGWIAIFPAHSSAGNLSGEISAMGSVYVFGVQVEQSSSMTSYIATSGTTATRTADLVTLPTSAIAGFAPTAAGAFRLDAELPDAGMSPGTLLQVCGSSCTNDNVVLSRGGSNSLQMNSISAGTSNPSVGSQHPLLKNSVNRIGASWSNGSSSALNLGVNGEPASSGANSSLVPNLTSGTIYFGNNNSQSSPTHMHLKKLEYWPAKLSAPAMSSW